MAKKIFLTLGIILILLVAAVIIVPVLYKGKIKQIAIDEINKNLNAKVTFGDFHLSLIRNFPNFTFSVEDVSVSGVDSFAADTLVFINRFSLAIDLMSVISGNQIGIRILSIDQPRIFAKVLRNGKASWDIAKSGSEEVKQEEPAQQESASTSYRLKLKKFAINNGVIVFDDRQSDMYASVQNLNFTLDGDLSEKITILNSHLIIDATTVQMGLVKYLNKARIEIKAGVDADIEHSKYTLRDNEFSLNKLQLGWNGFISMPSDDIEMDLKFHAKQTEFKELLSLIPAVYMRDFEKVKTSGKLSLEGSAKGIYRDSLLPSFTIKLLVDNAMFQYPDLPSSVDNINIDLNVSNPGGTDDMTEINIPKFSMTIAKNPFSFKLLLKTPVSDPYIDCSAKGRIDLNKLKEVVPLEPDEKLSGIIDADITLKGNVSVLEKEQYERFNATGKLAVSALNYTSKSLPQEVQIYKMEMNFTPQYVNLGNFEGKIGESDIFVSGRLENFIAYMLKDGAVLKGDCGLKSRRLNLNQLMSESSDPETTGQAATPEDTLPLSVIEVPANFDFILHSKIDHILYDKMEIYNTIGIIRVKDGRASMENLSMRMIDGSMTLSGYYETKNPDMPAIDFLMDINDFDIPKTFATFATAEKLLPIGKYCKGKFSSKMILTGFLDNHMEPVLNTLSGGGGLSTRNIQVENFEPLNKVADILGNQKLKKLLVSDVNLSFKFKEGRVFVEPFDVKLGQINANISGSNGFDQSLNYNMKMDVPTSELGTAGNTILNNLTAGVNQFGTNLSMGKSIKTNLKVTGTISDPSVAVSGLDVFGSDKSIKDQVKDNLEQKAREEADRLKKEAEEKARAEADRLKKEVEEKAKGEADRLKKEAEQKAKAEADRLKKEAEDKAKKEAADKLKNLFGKPKK